MRFTLSDIEEGKDIFASKKMKKKKKNEMSYTHVSNDEIPFKSNALSKYIDDSYDGDDEQIVVTLSLFRKDQYGSNRKATIGNCAQRYDS